MANHVLALKASVWRDIDHVCSHHWPERVTLPHVMSRRKKVKLSSRERWRLLMNNNTIYCSGFLQTRPYMNRSSVISLTPFPTTYACFSCCTPFFILRLLTQSSMRIFLASLQRNACTSVIFLIFLPCFIFLYSLTYYICHSYYLLSSFLTILLTAWKQEFLFKSEPPSSKIMSRMR